MDLAQCYKILNVSEKATDDELIKSFKKLAIKYHPDKNMDNVEWANEAMKQLNQAYTLAMSLRFKNNAPVQKQEGPETRHKSPDSSRPAGNQKPRQEPNFTQKKAQTDSARTSGAKAKTTFTDPDYLINRFVKIRETAKDSLYRFFQYNLNNIIRREEVANRGIFNELVHTLRRTYHNIKKLAIQTDDEDLLNHFETFNKMIFEFYRASECLNVIDNYKSQYEVDAYRIYKKGDECLHVAQKEIFFDRHNRGFFKSNTAYSHIINAEQFFNAMLASHPKSTWAVETKIKLDYTEALRKYVELFFTEE